MTLLLVLSDSDTLLRHIAYYYWAEGRISTSGDRNYNKQDMPFSSSPTNRLVPSKFEGDVRQSTSTSTCTGLQVPVALPAGSGSLNDVSVQVHTTTVHDFLGGVHTKIF